MVDTENRKRQLIVEEAASWHLRLNDGACTAHERSEYLQWLKQSPAHVAEALRMRSLKSLLQAAKLEQLRSSAGGAGGWGVLGPGSRWSLIAAVAAFVLLIVAVILINVASLDDPIETHAGEWRELQFPDGSVASLGPRTNVRFEFTAKERLVQLSRGEAMFTVVNDPRRPFYVNAGLVGVRAVGTKFSVSREDRMVLVTVAQGKVAVMKGDRVRANAGDQGRAADAGEEAVEAGKQYEATLRGFVGVHDVNVARELAWVQKMLIFSDGNEAQNVAQAVHEFNRRNRLQIEVTDPYIAARPVFGVFHANDPESFIKFLAKPLKLKVVRQGMDRVLLESTPQTPTR